jgi:hypothetical protein
MVALSNGRWAVYDEWSSDQIMYRMFATATSAELAARDYCEKHDVREAMRNEGVVL